MWKHYRENFELPNFLEIYFISIGAIAKLKKNPIQKNATFKRLGVTIFLLFLTDEREFFFAADGNNVLWFHYWWRMTLLLFTTGGKKTCDVSTTRKRLHHVSIADKEKGPQVCFYYRSRRPTLMRESAHPPSFHCWWRRGHRSANLHSIWSGCLLGTLPILYNKVNIISHYHTVTSMIS